MLELSSKLTELPRVGKIGAKLLKKLGLETIQDLLFYLPFKYEDFRNYKNIADLEPGENVNIRGEVMLIQNKRSFKKRISITEALIADKTDTIKIIWFNQSFLTKNIKIGDQISLAGLTSENQGQLALVSPQYEKVFENNLIHTAGLIPQYRLTKGLTQKQLRYFIKQIINLSKNNKEWLPDKITKDFKLLSLAEALHKIHAPINEQDIILAKQRLTFSELFLRQIKSQLIKQELNNQSAIKIKFQEKETRDFVNSLPFQLTNDQKKAAWEILQNISTEKPMSRLLEGDVGSGKTIVAALALFNAAINNQVSALMAPTEILAQQHFQSLKKLFANYKEIKISLLTSKHKDNNLEESNIIIGTQAIIQKNVSLKNLALAIVDEQHRFGVQQRKKILDFNTQDNNIPHFLSMTATPIPRSLALAIYGDLDLSIIKELPAGRKKIATHLIKSADRTKAYKFIEKQIKAGRQAFIICPLIEESDKLETKSVKVEYEYLSKNIFPNLKINFLHGKLKSLEKEKIMTDFLAKKIDILISTSVIEVGIDVPNATIIVIEGAERFGLAQLHQFRGRVGRSEYQSYCLLFTSKEEINNEKTNERLKALEKYHDGLTLAKVDLKLRGAGDVYGYNQSGFTEFQIASLFEHDLIKSSSEAAAQLIKSDPSLEKYPLLKNRLGEWEKSIHLE